jgi:hypothetical protein
MDKPRKNTIGKGQRGTVALLAISILFLISATLDIKSEYAHYFIYIMVACFIAAAAWNIIFMRCPLCKKHVGEYMLLGPPIKVSKYC